MFYIYLSAVGSGRSKKEAKHDAAKCILKRLNELGVSSTPEPDPDEIVHALSVDSPYKGMLQENAVGALQELCMTHEIQVPEYKVIGDEGPPHAKQFTIMCQVSKLEESAVSRTKKQAKQLAAFRMLNRLKSSLADVLASTAGEKDGPSESRKSGEISSGIAVSKYKELGSHTLGGRKTVIGLKISEYHLMMKNLDSVLLKRLKDGNEDLKMEAEDDPMGVLKRILEELNLDAEFNGIGTIECDQKTILLSISTSLQSVVFGTATTEEEACKMAATNALEHLKLMSS
ncbi:Interferon-inducible double-stranded RNA-dependent protein kinase activator A-like protein A [Cryptotermes secundus]|uniref:Interferon-inducible double-stranded RNA-dependent protein kinase activator A-like protein A n=1 Tax=Cryptotermes secundus TaxID=105785 RepID=A0A2J7RRK0_9NEOP|nr:RISC-loading complex subunit tarbp2 isoform X2 [Cryptotermes secundus]PNF43467.1 Interferon-inducible double-stranded RNA-dependent protein kinase activator A-like protein A [Cryptotermes secundus]